MSLYNDKKDYETLVKENIERANILYSLSEKDRIIVNNLLDKKEKIKKRNGIFANFELNRINKKLTKIKKKQK